MPYLGGGRAGPKRGLAGAGCFDEIVKLEEQLELHSTLLSNLEQRLEHTAIKAGRGLESVFNLEKMRREYQEQEHFQEVLRKSLDNAYLKLGALLGISDLAEYTILVEELLFEPMEPVNLELHIIRSIRNDPYIWLKEREIEGGKSLALCLYGVESLTASGRGMSRLPKMSWQR